MTFFNQHHPEALDKGALANTWHTADADANGISGMRQETIENILSQFLMINVIDLAMVALFFFNTPSM